MIQITLTNTGKRYNREWIFRHCNTVFSSGKAYAITGNNGSGKSTLLQVIAGAILQSEGSILYEEIHNGKSITIEEPYARLSIAAPYLDLIEEMTGREMLAFHTVFKPLVLPIEEVLSKVGLIKAADKQIRYYSSGMKQRLKLAQAFFSDTPVLLLDEPTTNLDAEGIELYQQLIKQYQAERLLIVSSNNPEEYGFCGEMIRMESFK